MFTQKKFKSIVAYSGYGLLGGLGTTIIPFIDVLMLSTMHGFVSSAIYTIPNFMTSAIDAPRKALSNIISPLLTDSWQKNDLAHIEELYQKSSLNQLIVGLFLFLVAWINIDHIYDMVAFVMQGKGVDYSEGKWVLLILGLSKIVDMVTGVNSEIIGYSKYFRFNFYAVLALTVFAIATNYWLIPKYGIEGAALATMLSFLLFNISKFLFLWWKFKLQPFSFATLKVILLGVFTYFISAFIPSVGWIIPNILIKLFLISSVFMGSLLYFKLSEDINKLVFEFWNSISKKWLK